MEGGFEFTDEERETILGLTWDDLMSRLAHLPTLKAREIADQHWGTAEFLKAAITGRFFYSRTTDSAFHAYQRAMPAQPNTVILDGTADLNQMYVIGGNVSFVTGMMPDYSNVQVNHVTPPAKFVGKMRPGEIIGNAYKTRDYLTWLKEFVISQTQPGEEVLVYGKKDLLAMKFQKLFLEDPVSEDDTQIDSRVHGQLGWPDCPLRQLRSWPRFQQVEELHSLLPPGRSLHGQGCHRSQDRKRHWSSLQSGGSRPTEFRQDIRPDVP
ncbi:MAG: hypothetical protein MZV65_18810 [Chromatiales bacterium]|nr:hypothetical protein [Chromatiales bacterium]